MKTGWKLFRSACIAAVSLTAAGAATAAEPVREYPIDWAAASTPAPAAGAHALHHGGSSQGVAAPRAKAGAPLGSTHEIAWDGRRGELWISGQAYDSLARLSTSTGAVRLHPMPAGSRPHGLAFDGEGRLWATLEYSGAIVRLAADGTIAETFPVTIGCAPATPGAAGRTVCPTPLNPHPHGLGIDPDGRALWFTGKATGTIGRLDPATRTVTHYALKTPGATPIYIAAGPDGAMWATELTGNAIVRIRDGAVQEFSIPTPLSRPIAIVPGPDGNMWFSQEAGNKVARVTPAGVITEFAVPRAQPNMILAGLAFDRDGHLWVQQYVDHNNPAPAGTDFLVRIDKAILKAGPDGALPAEAFAFYAAPTRDTMMHRVIRGPGGDMWFTEMNANKVGRVDAR